MLILFVILPLAAALVLQYGTCRLTMGLSGRRRGRAALVRLLPLLLAVTVIAAVADEFVTLVESLGRGEVSLTDDSARRIVEEKIRPLVASGADHLVLGCTHFPHLKPLIEEIAGPAVTVLDPSPAVAAQARRVLEARGLLADVV